MTEIIIAIVTAVAGGGCGWLLRSNRRKAGAEADMAEENVVALRERRYEQLVDFLQQQLHASGEEMAQKRDLILSQQQKILSLTEQLHNQEMCYLSSRCDNENCAHRLPPFPWRGGK